MNHSFNINIAVIAGIEESIILQNIYFWVLQNKEHNKHFYDGFYWTFNSAKSLAETFPYMSANTIRRSLQKLESLGYIATGNYNKTGFDQTKWYTITASAMVIIDNPTNLQNSEMESTKFRNGIDKNAKWNVQNSHTIPDINTVVTKSNDGVDALEFFTITLDDGNFIDRIKKNHLITDDNNVKRLLKIFNNQQESRLKKWKSISDYRLHFESWLKINKENYPNLQVSAFDKTIEKIRAWTMNYPNQFYEIFPFDVDQSERSRLIINFTKESLSGEFAIEFAEKPVIAMKNYFKEYCQSQIKN